MIWAPLIQSFLVDMPNFETNSQKAIPWWGEIGNQDLTLYVEFDKSLHNKTWTNAGYGTQCLAQVG